MEVPYVSKEVSNVVQLGLVMIVMKMVEGYQTFCHGFLLDICSWFFVRHFVIITLVAFVWLVSCMSYQMTP